jgi:hypothetical protein
MSKKVKQINIEHWLNEKKSWFMSKDFRIVEEFMSKQDSESLNNLCNQFKGGLTYLSKKHDARLYSPKTMLVTAIFGITPMLEFTMHSKYSILTHWLWRFLALVKYISILVIVGIAWYVYDILTVKRKTQSYNFDVFCRITGCQENEAQNIPIETTKTYNILHESSKKGKEKNAKAMKIMSIIGLVLYSVLIVVFGVDVVVNDFRDFYDSGALIILIGVLYAIPYSIVGLNLLKNLTITVMSLIGIIWNILVLSVLIWFYSKEFGGGELLSPFAGILFVLYNIPYLIVALIQSLKHKQEEKKFVKISS